MENQVTREDLKIQALLEKVGNLTATYENQIADFRVELTLVSQENEALKKKVEELEAPEAKGTTSK